MKASSEAARTSRVSAPIARPSAANASAASASAASQSGKRPQSRSTKSPSPASINSDTATEQTVARPAFSTSSAGARHEPADEARRRRSPRARARACPAASSSVMNMSETATASATANELSEVVPPSSAVASTWIGSPTTFSTSSEKARFSRASPAKRDHAVELGALRRARAAGRRAPPSGSPSERCSPSTSKSCPRNV